MKKKERIGKEKEKKWKRQKIIRKDKEKTRKWKQNKDKEERKIKTEKNIQR